MVPVFLLYGTLLVILSGCKSAGLFLPSIIALEHWFGGDKWMHFYLALVLSLLANFAAGRVIKLSWLPRILLVAAVLMVALILDEMHQYLVALRRFDLQDSVWGGVGVLAGAAFYSLWFFLADRWVSK
ncbi:VanZ family protein [Thalassolituus pacificus]|uniref:VanZ family protein n=1 Tax=Thalassolituus pacificus TaxID=2975440 RepID=A0A9X3AI22_9GAMM|nr:VanZ family protein [Thalassolituus pacificus]MCT7360092.1 VanZ family protein [Thalassolituus pacificus]